MWYILVSIRDTIQNMYRATTEIGWWGERLVAAYLQCQGFTLLDHNYRKTWGELDLVVSRDQKVHFVEVKSTVVSSASALPQSTVIAPFRPEQQVNARKLSTLRRMAETWMHEFSIQSDLTIDVAVAYISPDDRMVSVEIFWGVG